VKRLRYIIIVLYGLMFFDARSACPTASSAGSRAYRGREIKQAITDFYRSAAGLPTRKCRLERDRLVRKRTSLPRRRSACTWGTMG
ncbi:MAG TPA: hypothetical protein VJ255_13000, partial [Candidatus Acidoferrum sp.]|jgi:hypothetical protein|nr:hypothetical protein [Candidatus Acidoferrum sp.]